MSLENAIEVLSLAKYYDKLLAVDHITFNVNKGEVFGLLGPNGAGKTTTIKMLTTLLRPSDGSARVWGHDIQKDPDKVRKSIGVVFQDPSLDVHLTGLENMEFHAQLYDVPPNKMKQRIRMLLDLVELTRWNDKLVKTYSGGMRRRLEIARGLIHQPKVLFLDEPTLGLDPQSRRKIWEHIDEVNSKEGVTVILTTHYMEEADHVCNRVAIIDKGKIVALDTPNKLKNIVGGDVVTLEAGPDAKRLLEVFKRRRVAEKVQISGGQLLLTTKEGEHSIPLFLKIAEEEGLSVGAVSLRKPSLDDVFLHFTGKRIREEGPEKAMQMKMKEMKARRGM